MKIKVVVLLSTLISCVCFSQDILTYKNGTEVKVKVVEVTSSEVKFKWYDNIDGPLYTILKSDLFMVKYENGTKEEFSAQTTTETPSSTKTPPSTNVQGTEDIGYDRIPDNGPEVVTVRRRKGSGQIIKLLKDSGRLPFKNYLLLDSHTSESLEMATKGRKLQIAGALIQLPGGCYLAWFLSATMWSAMLSGESYEPLILALLPLSLVSYTTGLVLVLSGNKKVRKSIELYNAANDHSTSLKVGIGGSGLAITWRL